jgi:Fe-S-cluster-containing hydrogenase component 2
MPIKKMPWGYKSGVDSVIFTLCKEAAARNKNSAPARTKKTTPSEDTMQKSLHIDPGKCTGCLQCEMACSYEHTGAFNPSRSFIKVFTFHHEGRFAPYTCTQCDEAWCMHACPVEAISIDHSTGAKVVSDDKCVGCKVCTIACPFGTINYSQATGKVVKCDLCGGDPQCAAACPTDAITYIDADWTGYDRMLASAARSLPSTEVTA